MMQKTQNVIDSIARQL